MTLDETILHNRWRRRSGMTDREKVIKGLECCLGDTRADLPNLCTICPYAHGSYATQTCGKKLREDAIALLKAREPKPPVLIERTVPVFEDCEDGTGKCVEQRWSNWHCPNCKGVVGQRYKVPDSEIKSHDQHLCDFCHKCGQAINWNNRQ